MSYKLIQAQAARTQARHEPELARTGEPQFSDVAHAVRQSRAGSHYAPGPATILALQQAVGNQSVQRMLSKAPMPGPNGSPAPMIQRIRDEEAFPHLQPGYGDPQSVLTAFKRWLATGYQMNLADLQLGQFTSLLSFFYPWLDKTFNHWFEQTFKVSPGQCQPDLVQKVVPQFYAWLVTNQPVVGTLPLQPVPQTGPLLGAPNASMVQGGPTAGFLYLVPGTSQIERVQGNPEELGLVPHSNSTEGTIWTAPRSLITDDEATEDEFIPDDDEEMDEEPIETETDDGEAASEDEAADVSNQLPQMNRRRAFMDLFNAEPASPSAPGAKPKVRTETFNKMFDKSNRPAHAGPVSIELEQFLNNRTQQFNERPISISGLVVPTATKGRANAPESVTGFKAGMSFKQKKKGRNETQADAYRNRGRPDVQKGHIMALELGGPDIPKNIVPQWANWQANGAWRKMEKMVLAKAEEVAKRGRYVMFRAEPIYKGSALDPISSFNAKSFPSSFKIHAWEVDAKNQAVAKGWTFEAELDAHQDATDDMMFYRQDDRTMREQGQESPYDLEKDLGGKRAGEKKPKGGGKKK